MLRNAAEARLLQHLLEFCKRAPVRRAELLQGLFKQIREPPAGFVQLEADDL